MTTPHFFPDEVLWQVRVDSACNRSYRNQGDWVADCALYHVREGNFYGHPASLPARPDFDKEKVLSLKAEDFEKFRSPPAVWLVREEIANSPGSPIWDTTKGKFGVFEGQMFIGDQRQSNYFRSGVEKVNGCLLYTSPSPRDS